MSKYAQAAALPEGVNIVDVLGKPATRVVQYASRMKDQAKKLTTAAAVTRFKSDRLAYKGQATILCRERRAARKAGPVIIRDDLVRKMNEGLL